MVVDRGTARRVFGFPWQEQHDSALIEAALTNGAVDGAWHAGHWGVVFEICFDDEERWETFLRSACLRCARLWTACQIRSTACLSTAAGAAGQGTASRASQSPRRARALSRCPSPAPRRIWTLPAFHRRIRCMPGMAWVRTMASRQPRANGFEVGAARRFHFFF